MKQFKYILSSLVLLAGISAYAQTTLENPPIYSNYKIANGVATAKSVSAPDSDGYYTLTLETFATGVTTMISASTPVDVVLVLDYSGSMNQNYSGNTSKLEALKEAVSSFIDEMARNDAEDDDGNPRDTNLGNRIAVVTYATDATNLLENSSFVEDGGFVSVNTTARVNAIKSAVNNAQTGTGTQTGKGMTEGEALLAQSKTSKPQSKRVLVLFTDGIPQASRNDGFTESIANTAISKAYVSKNTDGATIFSIGLLNVTEDELTKATNMLHYVSSNYPKAESMAAPGDGNEEAGYYFDASDPEMSLNSIFKSIAKASAGSEKTIPGETMLLDAVSSSFEVPSNYTPSDVVVYYRTINEEGTDWVGSETTTAFTKVILPESYDLEALPSDEIATQLADENTVGVYLYKGKLMIVGFNYSKPDSEDADGTDTHPYDGNWVGWRVTNDVKKCAGKEVVIKFKIEAIDGVTGGDGTNTNSIASGVYVPIYDEDGNFIGYDNVNAYPYPQTDLPINLVIQKTGLRHGESATIQIYRAPQKAGEYDKVTGKPVPDTTNGWENFTKVILTNKGNDGETVTKNLLCLDPSYVYLLEEDDWGWGYILDTKSLNTSEKEANPFVFNNTLKVTREDWAVDGVARDPVKHAEAVSINHFGSNAHAETYKGSKVQSF